jgi:rubrerythrin
MGQGLKAKDQQLNKLIELLQAAYSGEKAAALAYQGHWASVSCPDEKLALQKIEHEEWQHRDKVLGMLTELGSSTNMTREKVFGFIGNCLKFLCPFSGWLLPMYCAWKLETANVQEYKTAAEYAKALGLQNMADELLKMAATEKEHEVFFELTLANKSILKKLIKMKV